MNRFKKDMVPLLFSVLFIIICLILVAIKFDLAITKNKVYGLEKEVNDLQIQVETHIFESRAEGGK
jgi:hypothetical protein